MKVRRRADYPPVICTVTGCKGKTHRIPPLDEGYSDLEGGEVRVFLCSKHWRIIPRDVKRERRESIRRWEKLCARAPGGLYWKLPPGDPVRCEIVDLEREIRAGWRRMLEIASGDHTPMDGDLPATMADELRKLGL